jgi:hypothetical protein
MWEGGLLATSAFYPQNLILGRSNVRESVPERLDEAFKVLIVRGVLIPWFLSVKRSASGRAIQH